MRTLGPYESRTGRWYNGMGSFTLACKGIHLPHHIMQPLHLPSPSFARNFPGVQMSLELRSEDQAVYA